MAQRYYERKDGQTPRLMKLWADPADYDQAEMQAQLARLETIDALDDETLAIFVGSRGGLSIGELRRGLQEEIDRHLDILDFFDYEKTTLNLPIADGAWFVPEAVESVCGEEVGFEPAKMIDGDSATYWQHDADEGHEVDLRLRSYPKQITGLRFRRFANPRSALTNLEIYVASSLGGLDSPDRLAMSGVTLSLDSDWNEVVFPSRARGKYIRLAGFGSADASNQVRIREIEARVVIHEYR